MSSRLADKQSKVVIVDPSGPVRQMMTEVVRATMGYEKVEGKASVQDLLHHLEVDEAAWAIIPLAPDQPVNGMHLLKLVSETPELKGVRVSFVLEESERYLLPWAYEMGLMSHHAKPFTKETLTEELAGMVKILEATKHNEPMIAASFLRRYLKDAKQFDVQIKLEKALLDAYPGDASLLMAMAEPQALSGKKEDAKRTLTLTKSAYPSLGEKVDDLAKTLLGPEEKISTTGADGSGLNVLGLKDCVVIDSDSTVSRAVADVLKSMGVPKVQVFSNGVEAWDALSKGPEPDLIVTEWRLPKLSGPLLVQRLRQHGFNSAPFIVLSSLLKPDDMPLVREMGIATIINKPLHRDAFVPGMVWTIQQDRLPTEYTAMERKYRSLLAANKSADAEPLRAQLLANPQVPLAKKRLIEAEYAFASGNYALARDAAADAVKFSGDSIMALNLLGKAFMYLKNPGAALKCFRKAEELSPNNIERLCAIAETETELGNAVAADDALDHARTLDPDSKTVQEAEAKVAIAKGDSNAAKKVMSQLESLSGLISYMNNKAVAHAKCGFTTEAIELYRKTLASIPDERQDTKTVVQYNLALGLARAGELEASIKELKQVAGAKNHKLVRKATSLAERLKSALATGANLKLQTEPGAESTQPAGAPDAPAAAAEKTSLGTEQEHLALMAKVEARRGDMCCYLIFTGPEPRDARVDSLLAKGPRFQRRSAIARAESHGVERGMKDAG